MQRQRFFFSTDLSRSGGGKEEICMGLNLEKGKTVERRGERFNCPWENGGWRKEGTSRVQFLYYYFKLPTFSTEHFRPQLKTHFDALNFHQMGDYVNNFRAKFILPFESENLLCTCVYIYICNRFSFSFFGEEEKKGRKEGRKISVMEKRERKKITYIGGYKLKRIGWRVCESNFSLQRHPSVFLRTWCDREEIGEAHLARHILAESTSHRRGLQSKMNRDTRRVVGD